MYIDSPGHERGILGNFALQRFGQEASLQFKTTLVGGFVCEDRVLNLSVFALLILHQELAPRCLSEAMDIAQLHAEILRTNDAFVDAGQHDRIDDQGTELLHEIQRQRRPAIMFDMQVALIGIKADRIHRAVDIVGQQGIAEAQERIHRIGRWTPDALREAHARRFEQVVEHTKIER